MWQILAQIHHRRTIGQCSSLANDDDGEDGDDGEDNDDGDDDDLEKARRGSLLVFACLLVRCKRSTQEEDSLD